MIFIIFTLQCLLELVVHLDASSSGSNGNGVKSNYQKAVTLIKHAKKYEKKGKTDKAKKRYKKALKLIIGSK